VGKINVDYDVLNQKGSPAWYSDLFANLPTPGYKGRMFISTDTFAFYRDNGVGWDLVGGPGTGTITGAGVFGQVTFFSGTDTISGNTDFVWDNTNKRLGINTGTPGAPLDIHTTGTAAQFNGTTTNNAFVLFQNAGTSKWRIGNLYNSGANDYQIYDVLNATARLTIKNTGASTLIGTFTATSLIKSGGTNLQILLADGTTTPTSTFGAGSVTSVSALTLGTSGTDLTSSVVNSTTTPVITLNVPTASATNRGALSSADWTTFNNKQATITLTTTGTSGAATLVGATLNIPNYTNVGTVTSVAALTLGTSGTDLSSTVANSTSTPVITLNVPTASATNRGALSSADFTTFNNKQATISVTAPVVLTGATISMPAATTSVNGYLTSTDWNTFNNKSNTNGTVTSVVALTIGTTGIDITSTAVTTTTTPVITLNIPTASASNRGALSSTDWSTFNNKQATLSLTTTGTSGVATLVANTLNVPNYGSALSGYLPLTGGTLTGPLGGTSATFSGDLTIDTNTLYVDSTNNRVGIGTNTPDSTLQVVGTIRWNDLSSSNGGTASRYIGITNTGQTSFFGVDSSVGQFTGVAYAAFIYTDSKPIVFAPNSVARVIIDTSGRTSIGYTTNPSIYNLDVNGTGRFTGALSGTSATFSSSVGIGTSSPAKTLDVYSTATTNTAQIVVSDTSTNRLYLGMFSDGSYISCGGTYQSGWSANGSNAIANIGMSATSGASTIQFETSTTNGAGPSERMRISGAGNVGIGTSAPSYTFNVQKSVAADYVAVINNTNTTNGYGLQVKGANGTSSFILSANDGTNDKFIVRGDGRVGIGTTTPTTILEVIGGTTNTNGYADGSIQVTGLSPIAFVGTSNLNPSLNRWGFKLREVNDGDFSIYDYTASATRLKITSGGVVNVVSRGNFLNATDNALFSLNSGGTLYTVGFSPTATASSTNTFTLTNGTTTWIYTGTGVATWTLPNPSGNNQIYWIKNAGTGIITLNAFAGTNIINNSATSVGSITIAVGATAVIAQDGNVKSYQLQ